MPLIKLWNFDRSVKKLIQADSLRTVKSEGGVKLGYSENDLLRVVFENDGTEVDSEEIFEALVAEKLFPGTVLMLIPENFVWSPFQVPLTISGPSQPPIEQVKELETSITTQIPSLLPSNKFSIPWESFPEKLISSCEKNEIPDPRLVRKMVRLTAEAVTKFKTMPERAFIRTIAQTIVNKYPVLRNPNSDVDKNYETIFTKLENCVQNLKRPARLSLQGKESTTIKKKREKKDEYGCVQWQPVLPPNETPDSQEEARNWLIEAYKNSLPHDENITLAMEKTYSSQRQTINAKEKIQAIKERWPYLFHEKYLYKHADKLLGMDVQSVWNESLKKVPSLISYFRTLRRRNEGMDQVLLKLEEAVVKKKSRMPEISGLLMVLSLYFGENESQLISYFEVTTSLSVIQDTRKRENLNPSICILGDSIFNCKGYVFVEDTVISDLAEMSDLLPVLFMSYYVFNICYPVGVEATLEFLQREFFNINPPGNKRGGKKKRTSVHPKVLTLQYNLQHHNSQWGQIEEDSD